MMLLYYVSTAHSTIKKEFTGRNNIYLGQCVHYVKAGFYKICVKAIQVVEFCNPGLWFRGSVVHTQRSDASEAATNRAVVANDLVTSYASDSASHAPATRPVYGPHHTRRLQFLSHTWSSEEENIKNKI